MAKIGASVSELGCGGHTPYSESAAFQYIREGEVDFSSQIYNNCSGKHAGFLALAKFLGLSTHDYLHPKHHIQVLIQEAAIDVFGIKKEELHIGIDGCSAPTFAVTVQQAARGYAKLSDPENHFTEKRVESIKIMTRAVSKNSNMVWGSGGFDTLLMKKVNFNF